MATLDINDSDLDKDHRAQTWSDSSSIRQENVNGSNHVFPATGMSTYYSAGKGGSVKSSASSSPVYNNRKQTKSGSISYGSISSSTGQTANRHSPGSTLSSTGFSSECSDAFGDGSDDMQSIMPKFRTVVKLSNDSERDRFFPPKGKTAGTHEDLQSKQMTGKTVTQPLRGSSEANQRQTTKCHQQPGGQSSNKTVSNQASSSGPDRNISQRPLSQHSQQHQEVTAENSTIYSTNRDKQSKVLVHEHINGGVCTRPIQSLQNINNKSSVLNGTHNTQTVITCASDQTDNMDITETGGSMYENYTPGARPTNGLIDQNRINNYRPSEDIGPPPSLPPRAPIYRASFSPLPTYHTHTQNNGSTGTASEVSDSMDSDTSSLNLDSSSNLSFSQHKFHMDQQVPTGHPTNGVQCHTNGNGHTNGTILSDEVHPFLENQRDVMNPNEGRDSKIVSSKGTVRGLKNLVRAGIATFADKQEGVKNYRQSEKGKVVVYTTTVMVVRETYERCITVKKILQNHMVIHEERDIFMSRENQRELDERLGTDKQDVPQVFADGQYLGGLEEIEKLNESGELRSVFKHFKRVTRMSSCTKCGGYRYIPCSACHGSKKSQNRNYFMDEFCALRCTNCDENGLIRCDICHVNDVIDS